MALDGAFLACLRQELTDTLTDARIDKIHQPGREELVIALRWKGGNEKLYLSAGANAPRLHFTTQTLENPAQPPMFCMLLREVRVWRYLHHKFPKAGFPSGEFLSLL